MGHVDRRTGRLGRPGRHGRARAGGLPRLAPPLWLRHGDPCRCRRCRRARPARVDADPRAGGGHDPATSRCARCRVARRGRAASRPDARPDRGARPPGRSPRSTRRIRDVSPPSTCRRTSCSCSATRARSTLAPSVAVVGTRRATDCGPCHGGPAGRGPRVGRLHDVSGLATGIDGAAHAATVHAGGTTIAVIGSGHAALFPRVHERLAASDRGGRRGDRVRARAGRTPDARHVPAPEPGHQRPRRRHRRGRGAGTQRRAHHRVVGPRAGPRVLHRPGPDRRTGVGRLPGVPARVRGERADRDGHPAAPRRPRAWRTAWPNRACRRTPPRPWSSRSRPAARIGRELVLGRATVDELVAVTGWPVASVLATLTLLERHGLAAGVHGRFRPAGALAAADPASARSWSSARI